MKLVLISKNNRKVVKKMSKSKIVQKNEYMRDSEAKGYETGQDSVLSPKRGFFLHVLIFFNS